MATAATGGQPTTTTRTYAFSGAVVNFDFYTCPANTYSEVFLDRLEIPTSCSGSSVGIGSPSTVGGFVRTTLHVSLAAIVPQNIPIPDKILWDSVALSVLAGRAIDPIKVGANIVGGKFILYPGETLFMLNSAGAGTVRFRTIEVTAGS